MFYFTRDHSFNRIALSTVGSRIAEAGSHCSRFIQAVVGVGGRSSGHPGQLESVVAVRRADADRQRIGAAQQPRVRVVGGDRGGGGVDGRQELLLAAAASGAALDEDGDEGDDDEERRHVGDHDGADQLSHGEQPRRRLPLPLPPDPLLLDQGQVEREFVQLVQRQPAQQVVPVDGKVLGGRSG